MFCNMQVILLKGGMCHLPPPHNHPHHMAFEMSTVVFHDYL